MRSHKLVAMSLAAVVVIGSARSVHALSDDTLGATETAMDSGADLDLHLYGEDVTFAGGSFLYFVQVANFGPGTATGVVISDELPLQLTLLEAEACTAFGGCTPCSESGGVLTCSLGALEPFEYAYARIGVQAPSEPATLVNEATISSDNDFWPDNNSASFTTEVVWGADVSGTLSIVGLRHPTVTLLVANLGPDMALAVQAGVHGGGSATIVSASTDRGECGVYGGPYGDDVYCALGDLPAGETAAISVVTDAAPGGGLVEFLSYVYSSTPDPDFSNNNSSAVETLPGAMTSRSRVSLPVGPSFVAPPCIEGPLWLEGQLDLRYGSTLRPDGSGLLTYVADASDVRATSLVTGETYRANAAVAGMETILATPSTMDVDLSFDLVGEQTGNRFSVTESLYVWADAHGVFVYLMGEAVGCAPPTGRFVPPTGSVAVDFSVDDSANRVYAEGDLKWKGSFLYDAETRLLTFDPSWWGALPGAPPLSGWPTLYDDGPWTRGGHEPIGARARDHVWGVTVFVMPPAYGTASYQYGLIDVLYEQTLGNGWIWKGPNGSFSVEAGATSPILASGWTIPPFGSYDLQLGIDVNQLAAGYPWNTSSVMVKSSAWGWGLLPMEPVGDGTYTLELAPLVGADGLLPHTGLLAPGDVAEFVFVLGGVEYKSWFLPGPVHALTEGVFAGVRAADAIDFTSVPIGLTADMGNSFITVP